ncbi:MAG: DNA polymerase I [Syntrophales bacterium]|nr:DNA polymerase I [Syntrophales bacterium]
MNDTVYLIDGNNYFFRAFYAVPELSNSQGFPTNAIYGFTLMLLKLLKEKDPRYVAVCFDVKGPTFRHEAYANYKATRRPIPDSLIPQIPYVKEISQALGCTILEQEGLEADDIIGTLAKRFAQKGLNVVIVSGDKDLLQLVNNKITMIDTMKDKIYDVSSVKEKFGVEPSQIVDLLALAGDSSDNIPGVPGIGMKGAQRLLEEFGSLENMLAHIDRVKNARAQAALREYADRARLSQELARIKTDAPVMIELTDIIRRDKNEKKLLELFGRLEFSSLLKDIETEGMTLSKVTIVDQESSLSGCMNEIRQKGKVAVILDLSPPDPMNGHLKAIGLATEEGKGYYIPLINPQKGFRDQVVNSISSLFRAEEITKSGHDLKTCFLFCRKTGQQLYSTGMDTMLAAYVLNPSRKSVDLSNLILEHTGKTLPSTDDGTNVATKACAVLTLERLFTPLLSRDGLDQVLKDIELPLIPVLADMEYRGVLIDTDLLQRMSEEMEFLLNASTERIYLLAGERFNINSPKQLQSVLFEKLKLPPGRKTKEGYSTDVEVLTQLASLHELPAELLAYRSLSKLKSTYVDNLPQLVNPRTKRVHTSYNQAVTATGRLSSSNPNLQNIPIRTPEGKRIRQAFIAPPGYLLISADYSQVELRVLAHLSGDENLLAAFHRDQDIHRETASKIFGLAPEEVTETMRRQAKVINFGIIYGMSAFGLAKELGIHQKVAQAYIDEYFHKYPGVKNYLSHLLEEVRNKGYTTTLFQRRRYIPEIGSNNNTLRQMAERMAINTPIQGTAADIIKLAMIRLNQAIKSRGLDAHLIIQVHDELVVEVKEEEREAVAEIMKQVMEGVIELKAPLKVEIGWGKNWDEAHGR